MNTELEIYRQNRINELQTIHNSNISRLNTALSVNINNIQKSTLLSSSIKNTRINNLRNQYNRDVIILKTALMNNTLTIKNFVPQNIIINKNKSALLIGINYTGTRNQLYGCINDTFSIKERIEKNGFKNITVMTDLTDKKATRANILQDFTKLLTNSQAGDLLFFLFSGHGSYAIDKNGDENTGYDQLIVPCDLNVILDDELKQIIQTNLKPNVTLFAMFDSCFSGSVLDLKYQYMDSLNYDKYTENNKQLETLGDVFMISGCNDKQTSADAVFNNKANGAMTWSLLEAIKTNSNCTWRELVKNMRDLLKKSKFSQIPQFSCGKFKNIDTPVFI